MSLQNGNSQHPESFERRNEVRVGLVMYGGVSLAIYINGVAREFFRAVRGNGVYKLLKALRDTDLVVDIVSGTSAGGINGILLAYALCNDKDFASTANLWRRDGDIRRLLRSPDGSDPSQSILNSEGYYQPRLEDAFRGMEDYTPQDDVELNFNSNVKELDLFVTGTDVDGNIYTQFDDAGHPIDVKDHRSIFVLKHRAGRKEQFSPYPSYHDPNNNPAATFGALAKLARITSCFPAFFAPVHVSTDNADEDRKLQLWGALGKDACFLDGGVIDNKPFTYTLREIFNRTSTREVDRKLFYVEPDPERWTQPARATKPNILQAVLASLIGIPGYESISDDLKLLATHNTKLKQYRRLVSALKNQRSAARSDRATNGEASADSSLYEQSRLMSLSERVVRGVLRKDGAEVHFSPEERRVAAELHTQFDKHLGKSRALFEDFDVSYRLRRLYHVVYVINSLLYGEDLLPAKGTEKMLQLEKKYKGLWAALNRQIEILEILQARMENLIDGADFELHKKWESVRSGSAMPEEVSDTIWWEAGAALNMLLNTDIVIPATGEEIKIAAKLRDAYRTSLKKRAPVDPQCLNALSNQLKKSVAYITQNFVTNNLKTVSSNHNLLDILDSYEAELLSQFLTTHPGLVVRASQGWPKPLPVSPEAFREGCRANPDLRLADVVHQAYYNFRALDEVLLPIELIGDLNEKDIVETIRISPADAEKGFSSKSLADKVSGDALYHFGSFFKRSWRSNDILWGRLDGCCQLIETLLVPEKIEAALSGRGRARVRAYFCLTPDDGQCFDWIPAMSPEKMFPHAGAETHRILREWVGQMLSADEEMHRGAFVKEVFDERLRLLIEAAQLEILWEEVPNVITDALEEQTQWNQFNMPVLAARRRWPFQKQVTSTVLDPKFSFTPAQGSLDPFVAVVAAAGKTNSVMESLKDTGGASPKTPADTRMGRFFKNEYRVGTEDLLRDMPMLVLFEIISVSMLVLRNCILDILGPNAARVRGKLLYQLGVDLPLRAFHSVVILLRRAPGSWLAIQIGLAVLAVLALLVGINWRNPIFINDRNEILLKWFLVFIVLPVVVLGSQAFFLWRGRITNRHWRRWLRDVGVTLLLVTPVLSIVLTFQNLLPVILRNTKSFYQLAQEALFVRFAGLFWPSITQTTPKATGLLAATLDVAAHGMVILTLIGCLVGIVFGINLRRLLGRSRKFQREDLEAMLVRYFSIDEIDEIARRLEIELPASVKEFKARQSDGLTHVVSFEANLIAVKHESAAKLVSEAALQQRTSKLGWFAERFARGRKAVEVFARAFATTKSRDRLGKLEQEMRQVNPEALR